MTAIPSAYSHQGPSFPAIFQLRRLRWALPDLRQIGLALLVGSGLTIPDASIHAKWAKLSLVSGLALHHYRLGASL